METLLYYENGDNKVIMSGCGYLNIIIDFSKKLIYVK